MEALAELLGESPAIHVVRGKLRKLLEGQPAVSLTSRPGRALQMAKMS